MARSPIEGKNPNFVSMAQNAGPVWVATMLEGDTEERKTSNTNPGFHFNF